MSIIEKLKEDFGFEMGRNDHIEFLHPYVPDYIVDVVVIDRESGKSYTFEGYNLKTRAFPCSQGAGVAVVSEIEDNENTPELEIKDCNAFKESMPNFDSEALCKWQETSVSGELNRLKSKNKKN